MHDAALMPSRAQFALTAIFHILWPILTISLSAFILLMEALWLRRGEIVYYHHVRYWSKLLVLNFAVGVVSGFPMEFQFGTNWAPFSRFTRAFMLCGIALIFPVMIGYNLCQYHVFRGRVAAQH